MVCVLKKKIRVHERLSSKLIRTKNRVVVVD